MTQPTDSTPAPQPSSPVRHLGLLGGGQLGRYLVEAAHRKGLAVHLLTPEVNSPASQWLNLKTDTETVQDYTDATTLGVLAQRCDAVTMEFENIPTESLGALSFCVPVMPSPTVLGVSQDRWMEKSLAKKVGLPVAPVLPIASGAALAMGLQKLGTPCVLKTRRLGYDGKGQTVLREPINKEAWDKQQCEAFWASLPANESGFVLEQWVPWLTELSVGVARDTQGRVCILGPFENTHANGILDTSIFPAQSISSAIQAQAVAYTQQLADALDVVGLLCVEWFVTANPQKPLMFNEMAPRPHNSGHLTLNWLDSDGIALPSQYDRHIEAIMGRGFAESKMPEPAAMINLLGDSFGEGPIDEPSPELLKDFPEVSLHWYGKTESRTGRKMGHLNWQGSSNSTEGLEQLRQAKAHLSQHHCAKMEAKV
ncbi:MAG: ATP-grasp domain-containing protein [Vampirovibrionales bacterium]|nr:ATP-grasp domain-containing protein [Vampirovibrionales bacterium]